MTLTSTQRNILIQLTARLDSCLDSCLEGFALLKYDLRFTRVCKLQEMYPPLRCVYIKIRT